MQYVGSNFGISYFRKKSKCKQFCAVGRSVRSGVNNCVNNSRASSDIRDGRLEMKQSFSLTLLSLICYLYSPILTIRDLLTNSLWFFGRKWKFSKQQCVHYNTDTPHIHLNGISEFGQSFWCKIINCAG